MNPRTYHPIGEFHLVASLIAAEPGRNFAVSLKIMRPSFTEDNYYHPAESIDVTGDKQIRALRDLCQHALDSLVYNPTLEQREWLAGLGSLPSNEEQKQRVVSSLKQRFDLTHTTAEAILDTWLQEGKRK